MKYPRTDAQLSAALDDAHPQTNPQLLADLPNRELVLPTAWALPTLVPPKKPKRRKQETPRQRADRLRREAVRAKVALIRKHRAAQEAELRAAEWRRFRHNRLMDALAAARFAREQVREYRVTCAAVNHRLAAVAGDEYVEDAPLPIEDRYC